MNFHPDSWIMKEVHDHYDETRNTFGLNKIVGVFLQGSQNYGLDYESSDVDTKAVLLPSFKDIVLNKQPISTTHVREDNSHTDWKDMRLMLNCFRKQNLNFLEILFTPYFFINSTYGKYWAELIEHREEIVRYNPYQAVKSMKGIAMEKYHAMEHEYPSKVDILAKYGYDPKQLHHLLRVEEYIGRYINGEPYKDCLHPHRPDYLIDVKKGYYDLETARIVANTSIDNITRVADAFCETIENKGNPTVDEFLDNVMYKVMKKSMEEELNGN